MYKRQQYKGLVINDSLVTKLNNLENKVNDLIMAYNYHTHTGVQTGGGTSGTTPTVITGSLTPTNETELQNQNVKHG